MSPCTPHVCSAWMFPIRNTASTQRGALHIHSHTHLPTVSIDLQRIGKCASAKMCKNHTTPSIARSHTRTHKSQLSILMIFPFSWQLHGQWNRSKNCDRKRNFHRMWISEERMSAAVNGLGGEKGNENYRIRHGFQWCSADNNFFYYIHFFLFISVWRTHTHSVEFNTNVCKK